MNSRKMQMIYKRLMMLGLLSMCLFVFGYSEATEPVHAAACIQDCEAYQDRCNDSCMTACSTTDTECNNCITSCQNQFSSCMRFAVSCPGGGGSGTVPECQVNFGRHCPVETGLPNCSSPNAHYGYSEICNRSFGFQCVSCPDHEICYTNDLPPCF